jgi:hypothetical protein
MFGTKLQLEYGLDFRVYSTELVFLGECSGLSELEKSALGLY